MADNEQRRVKSTGAGTHRTGQLRAAVKPHKRATASAKSIINEYMDGLRSGTTSHTIWGDNAAKNAEVLRKNFGLASTDEPYLLLDGGDGTGRSGLVLSTTGLHLGDGRGNVSATSWDKLADTTVGLQRGMLVIGQSGIVSTDAQVIAALLQELQTKLAK